jgi:deoxycytidylate deaminase
MVGATATTSVHARTVSGTQTGAIILRDTTAAATKCTGTISGTTTWLSGDARANCTSAITTGNSHSTRIYPGGTGGTGTMVVWGAQREVGESMSPYIPTTTAAATRNADDAHTFPAQYTQTSGCWAATARLTASSNSAATLLSFWKEGRLYITGTPGDAFSQTALLPNDGQIDMPAGAAVAGTSVTLRGDWRSGNPSQWGNRIDDEVVENLSPGLQHLSRDGAGTVEGVFRGDFSPNDEPTDDIWLGSRTAESSMYLNGYLKAIRVNRHRDGCQP